MNTLKNTIKGLRQKRNLLIFVILLLINTTWIHSQNSLDTDSTKIAYKELTEVAKYVAYKDSTKNIFTQYHKELNLKDSIISIKDLKIKEYSTVLVPTLKTTLRKKDSIILNKDGLLEISDIKLKSQTSKKWAWLGSGALIGVLAALLIGG